MITKTPREKKKILFLLRKNSAYGYSTNVPKAGLYNSALMAAKELEHNFRVDTDLRVLLDANGIDRQIHLLKPEVCILEALWVTPDKLKELVKLHPNVKFVIRIHSEIPFLANEGIAIEWIKEYVKIDNTTVAFNSITTLNDFRLVMGKINLDYLPNLYEDYELNINSASNKRVIKIGCFGAIRPLKNQLLQAFAAIAYGNKNNRKVEFHINASRLEQGGNASLKNIRALFENSPHKLVEHDWMDRKEFLNLINRMDLGMQMSLTESFNLVTADFVSQGVPIVVSPTIDWMPDVSKADADSIEQIVSKLEYADRNRFAYVVFQNVALQHYKAVSTRYWERIFDLKNK